MDFFHSDSKFLNCSYNLGALGHVSNKYNATMERIYAPRILF